MTLQQVCDTFQKSPNTVRNWKRGYFWYKGSRKWFFPDHSHLHHEVKAAYMNDGVWVPQQLEFDLTQVENWVLRMDRSKSERKPSRNSSGQFSSSL